MTVVVYPDVGEERSEKLASDRSVRGGEQGVWPLHEVEVTEHHGGAVVKVFVGGVQAGVEAALLDVEVAERGAEFVGR
ncbi:hypothetical protein [Microbacterium sp. 4NA327F11]|nr:hypothetical protein [Microbacterium sp. 4NA327F11]